LEQSDPRRWEVIEYKDGVVLMDLVDLEHCGFDVGEFHFELQAAGIDDPAAVWPVALLVNFIGGAVVGPCTSDKTVMQITEADSRFQALRRRILDNGGG